MVIIGGVGTVLGSFLGAAFVTVVPVLLSVTVRFLDGGLGLHIPESAISNLELMCRRPHHLLPDRRPHGLARPVADRGEAAAVAVPALIMHIRGAPAGSCAIRGDRPPLLRLRFGRARQAGGSM
jgi:hypothetical protein